MQKHSMVYEDIDREEASKRNTNKKPHDGSVLCVNNRVRLCLYVMNIAKIVKLLKPHSLDDRQANVKPHDGSVLVRT